MKHFTFSAALFVLMCSSFATLAQNVIIPDPNFKAALVGNAQINTNGDSEIQVSEASAFNGTVNVQNLGISDLTGIEAFTAIPRLYCNNNLLTSLNVSQNTALVALRCNHNQLTSLDVSNNTALTDLRCYVNRLSSVDVSTLDNLQTLHAFQNMLTSLSVAGNSQLRDLRISFNQVRFLDLRDNHMLTYLDVKQNSLEYIILQNGNNSNITYFNALHNDNLLCIEVDNVTYSEANWTNVEPHSHFSHDCAGDAGDILWFPDANFEAVLLANPGININGDEYIQGIEARNYTGSIYAPNKNISEMTGVEYFPKLTELVVYGNNIQDINVRENRELRLLKIHNNPLGWLDITQNSRLTALTAHNTPLTSLDLSGNPELTSLWCFDSELASLDLTHNNKLVDVQLNHNRLTSLQLGEQPNLKTLLAYQNQLTSLDVSHAPALVELRIQLNKLTGIDLAMNSSLRELNVGDNLLTGLDLTGKPDIRVVDCYNNQLTTLDISQNPTVFSLRAYKNKLTVLNVKNGNNTVIRGFDVTRNPNLTCIQVDDPAWSEASWTMVDPQANFSVNCGYPGPDVVNIPDRNFRERLYTLGVDTNGDRLIQYTEARAFTAELMLVGAEISDATGVEAFINVSRMNWEHNDITKLDLRFNSGLRSISCGITPLTDLQVNPQLELLECYTSPLTSLNLYNNNSLKYIDASETQLEGFNLGDYPFASTLEFFAAGSPRLVHLDLTAGVNLTFVGVGPSILMSLDLSRSTNLKAIRMSNNSQLSFLNIKNGNNANMTEFSLQGHPVLDCIEVDDVAYAEENFDIEPHTHFSEDCDGSETAVYIPDANFKRVLVSNPELNTNHDSEIQVTEARAYTGTINVRGQDISDLTGFEEFYNTSSLDVTDNNLTSIFLRETHQLREIFCGNNQINQFSIGSASRLTRIVCPNNRMEFLVLSPQARVVDASNNLISFFTPGYRATLERLYLNNNRLTQLEIPVENTDLEVLHVENNNLTWLNIQTAGPEGLTELEARGNDLTCIKVNDPAFAEANWRDNVDAGATFNEDCEGDPNIVYIPDPNLKSALVALVDGYDDQPMDGEVQYQEATAYYSGIEVQGRNIQDMTGIGAFNNAGYVDCSNNQLTRLDEAPGGYEGGLDISHNQITEITVSLAHLSYVNARYNRLTALPQLGYIYELLVDHNELTSIDGISTENYVGIIHAEFNKITSVNFGNYHELYEIHLNDNLLTSLDILSFNTGFTTINVLNVGNNRLTSLNIRNGENDLLTTFNAIGNPDLLCIQVDDPAQAEADWRDNVDPQANFSEDCTAGEMFSVAVSPNPTMGRMSIESTRTVDEVQIMDGISGDLVGSASGPELDISGLSNGVYLLRVRCGGKVMTTRIVKQ